MPLKNPKALVATVRKLRSGTFAAHVCDREPDGEEAAYPLTTSNAIVVLECSRYAYQTTALVFRAPRDRPAAAMILSRCLAPLCRQMADTGTGRGELDE